MNAELNRASRPRLDHALIVAAAIDLIEQHGEANVSTRMIGKALGVEAREFLRALLGRPGAFALRLRCETYDPTEKFGRILGDILIEDASQPRGAGWPVGVTWRSAREELLAYGRARAYDGGKR